MLEPPRPKSNRSGKVTLSRRVAALRRRHPHKTVELWAEDEARLGLKPVARRVWALRGTRPICPSHSKYEWLYVYGFAHPASGRNLPLILPRADTEWMEAALGEFSRWADPEGKKLLVLVVDNAGWHTASRLAVPENVVLHPLPSCTPELQPVEPLWPLVREAVANQSFDDLNELEQRLVDRCRWLIQHPETVKAAVGFHWAAKRG